MSTVHMPGFTGEASLYETSGNYRLTGSVVWAGGAMVEPQLVFPPGTTCTPCVGNPRFGCYKTCCLPLRLGGRCYHGIACSPEERCR
jgi:hypothetical protein